jgi:hypothetical protein
MANNRTLTVKVPRTKLIEALTKAASDRAKSVAEHDKAVEKWRLEMAKAEKDFFAKVKSGKVKTNKLNISHRESWRSYDSTETQEKEIDVTITFKVSAKALNMPAKPENKYKNKKYDWNIKEDISEIENAIRILNLSTDEFVSTSTYKSVAQFL